MRIPVLIATVAMSLVLAVPAGAQQAGGNTAPAYLGNTIKLSQKTPLVAGTIVRTQLSGHADWKGPTSSTTTSYSLALFPQNADVSTSCAASQDQQRTAYINLPALKAVPSFSAFVLDGQLVVNPNVPAPAIDWSVDSPPYAIKEGVDKVLLCGYVRYITDHVAGYQIPVDVTPQACRLSTGKPRKGTRLGLRCNVSGKATITFRRGSKARRVSTTIAAKDGRTKLSTSKLSRGSYKMAVRVGKDQIGKTLKLRVR